MAVLAVGVASARAATAILRRWQSKTHRIGRQLGTAMEIEFAHEVFAMLAGGENADTEPVRYFPCRRTLWDQCQKLQLTSCKRHGRQDIDIGFRLMATRTVDRGTNMSCAIAVTVFQIGDGGKQFARIAIFRQITIGTSIKCCTDRAGFTVCRQNDEFSTLDRSFAIVL